MHYSIKYTPLAAAVLLALNTPLYSPQTNAAVPVAGDAMGSEFAVNTYTTNNQKESSIAMDADGDFVITWSSVGQDGDGYGIYAQRYNANGSPAGGEFTVNTYTTGIQSEPSIAMDADGDFVIAWQSSAQDGDSNGIIARRYNADGTPASSEFAVNNYTTSRQTSPTIAMDADGDFVVAWMSYEQEGVGNDNGIYAQRFNADGTTAGSEFHVNTITASGQAYPSIAMNAGGRFAIAWQSYHVASKRNDIYARRYDATGTALDASEFAVNTYTAMDQRTASIAMDVEGDIVITWNSSNAQDGDGYGVYARRYNAAGTALDVSEFVVNTYTTLDQAVPAIAMDADGDFVIAWQSNLQDLSSWGIYAQRYNADGSMAGTEFAVNTYTTERQNSPSIAMDADGDFVIAWNDFTQDGNGYGIYAQRYYGAGETVDLNLVVQDDTDPVSVGNNFVYSLITTNNGNGIAMDVNLSELLPAGVSYVSNDGASEGWNCSEDAGTVSCNKPFMIAAETNTIFLTVSADLPGTVSNTATVNAAQTDANATDNASTQTTLIEDTTAPVISLLGDNPMTVTKGSVFTDPGVTITDNVDTGLTATVSGSVDTATAGIYILSYDVTDNAGNAATTVTRGVEVKAPASSGDGGSLGVFTLLLTLPVWLRRWLNR